MEKVLFFNFLITVGLGITCAKKCIECGLGVNCPVLPAKDCEDVTRPCSCCKECARRVGEQCSWSTVRCASGLMCINDDGEALVHVPRFLTYFKGTCQFVVIQPVVVENTDVTERRNRI
ncbi:perlustrin-like protein [Saccostrea cucullata]|uniref:perlustrin-like protein n=1 Tax=Saccostrea cuccullata TaxID=36930 RepID=UPI002ED42CB4